MFMIFSGKISDCGNELLDCKVHGPYTTLDESKQFCEESCPYKINHDKSHFCRLIDLDTKEITYLYNGKWISETD